MTQPQVTDSAPSAPAHPKKPKRERKKRDRGLSSHAFTISEFCDSHRLSRAQFYKLQKLGQGPDVARAGDRVVFISGEAAARWRRQREKAERA
jgi:hypothetical protein